MTAVVAEDYGPPEAYSVKRVPVPRAAAGQIQVRIRAAAVNPLDIHLFGGDLRDAIPMDFPQILGNDFAGTVTEVGPDVTRFAVGDEVFGVAFPRSTTQQVKVFSEPPSLTTGTLAEYAVVEADPYVVGLRPDALDPHQAAALPMAGLTALTALRLCGFKDGDKVLVAGATGAIGSVVVPLLADAGAHVIATAPAEDDAYVRSLGAADTVDYRTVEIGAETLRLHPDRIDGIVNLALGEPLVDLADRVLRPGGTVASVGYKTPKNVAYRADLVVHDVYAVVRPGELEHLVQASLDGVLPPMDQRRYSLADGARACVDIVRRHTRGKLLVTP